MLAIDFSHFTKISEHRILIRCKEALAHLLGRRAVFAISIVCLVLQASAQDSLRQPFFRSPWGRALQSAAIPGLGQAAQGDWLRGGLFLAGEAFLALDAFHFWDNQYQRVSSDAAGRRYDRDTAYGLAVWYSLGALFAAADAGYGSSRWRETRPTMAALRSIFFPGWGQLANGRRWKAAGMFALQTGFAFGAFTQHERFLYHDGRGESADASFFKNDRNRLIWWSVGIAIFSAADAFVDCHLRDWNVSEKLSLGPAYFPKPNAWGLGLRLSFSQSDTRIRLRRIGCSQ